MAGQVTLADVARAAGVSLATASRALHGATGRTVRADLADRVLSAARRLNYSPNANAQAMVRGPDATVGLIVHDIADPFAAAVASGVMAAAAERGLIVTIASALSDPDRRSGTSRRCAGSGPGRSSWPGPDSATRRCSAGSPTNWPAFLSAAGTWRRSVRSSCR